MTDEKNLDVLRDEKCVPVAQAILGELSAGLMKEDLTELILKALSVELAADLNVSQEVAYIPQLILGVLAGYNASIQKIELVNDDVRYNDIASKILAIIAKANIRMVSVKPEDVIADFGPALEELKGLFATEKLSRMEVEYIRDNIFNQFTSLNNGIGRSIESATSKVEAKMLGIESLDELSLQKLDSVLKSDVK
jgi:hypothetical protein